MPYVDISEQATEFVGLQYGKHINTWGNALLPLALKAGLPRDAIENSRVSWNPAPGYSVRIEWAS
jgi:hypothetical protein